MEINIDELQEQLEKTKEDTQSLFDEDGYLKTFKGIREQFISILEKKK